MTQENEDENIEVTFKIIGCSETVTLPLPKNITVESLKIMASDYTDLSPSEMRLIIMGRAMRDGFCLSDYSPRQGTTIHVVKERPIPFPFPLPPNQNQPLSPPQNQQQGPAQIIVPDPVETIYPPPSSDLMDLRNTVSRAQRVASEISLYASALQNQINQMEVNNANSTLATLCRRYDEGVPKIKELNEKLLKFHARNDENGNLVFDRTDGNHHTENNAASQNQQNDDILSTTARRQSDIDQQANDNAADDFPDVEENDDLTDIILTSEELDILYNDVRNMRRHLELPVFNDQYSFEISTYC